MLAPPTSVRVLAAGLALCALSLAACAGPSPARPGRSMGSHPEVEPPPPSRPAARGLGAAVARSARAQVGAPYRWGGASPAGFDCSGLVIYSFEQAGISGLPHSATGLDRRARGVPIQAVEPGDLLFFELSGKKASHVGIYIGGREFVHAPSSGRRVERVSFDHVYWSQHIRRAGRITF